MASDEIIEEFQELADEALKACQFFLVGPPETQQARYKRLGKSAKVDDLILIYLMHHVTSEGEMAYAEEIFKLVSYHAVRSVKIEVTYQEWARKSLPTITKELKQKGEEYWKDHVTLPTFYPLSRFDLPTFERLIEFRATHPDIIYPLMDYTHIEYLKPFVTTTLNLLRDESEFTTKAARILAHSANLLEDLITKTQSELYASISSSFNQEKYGKSVADLLMDHHGWTSDQAEFFVGTSELEWLSVSFVYDPPSYARALAELLAAQLIPSHFLPYFPLEVLRASSGIALAATMNHLDKQIQEAEALRRKFPDVYAGFIPSLLTPHPGDRVLHDKSVEEDLAKLPWEALEREPEKGKDQLK